MSPLQRLQLRQSEVRERINALLGQSERSDEERNELRSLTGEAQNLEVEVRAALVAEPEPEDEPATQGDREAREREELRAAFNIGAVVSGVFGAGRVDGREAEFQRAEGVAENQIPFSVFEGAPLEQRAVTPAPATADLNMRVPVPQIFAMSIAGYLGIEMPAAGSGDYAIPVLTTGLKAAPKAKAASADEQKGVFTVTSVKPVRLTGSFRVNVEDLARLRSMDAALRMNLRQTMLDSQLLNGSGSGDGTINGLLAQLTDPTVTYDLSGNAAYAQLLKCFADHVDGVQAPDEGAVSGLLGLSAYRIAAATVATDRSRSAAATLRSDTGGLRASAKFPAVASKKEQAIIVRRRAGVANGLAPHWNSFTVDDMYSSAGEGERVITAVALVGDVVITRASGFAQTEFTVAS